MEEVGIRLSERRIKEDEGDIGSVRGRGSGEVMMMVAGEEEEAGG